MRFKLPVLLKPAGGAGLLVLSMAEFGSLHQKLFCSPVKFPEGSIPRPSYQEQVASRVSFRLVRLPSGARPTVAHTPRREAGCSESSRLDFAGNFNGAVPPERPQSAGELKG